MKRLSPRLSVKATNLILNFKLVCLLLPSTAYSADLLDVYGLAVASDPTIRIAADQRKSTQEALPQARAAFFPKVDGFLDYAAIDPGNIGGPEIIVPVEPPIVFGGGASQITREYGVEFTLQQSILDIGHWFSLEKAQHIVSQADAVYEENEQDLLRRVATAYFNVLSAEDTLTFVRAEKKAVSQQANQTEEQFRAGVVAITDYKEAKARYDQTIADEISAENALDDAKEALQEITGSYMDNLTPLKPVIPLIPPKPMDEEAWVDIAEVYNPRLQAAKLQVEAMNASIGVAESKHLPTLTFEGIYGQDRDGTPIEPEGNFDPNWSFVVSANFNLFAGGSIQSGVRQAQYNSLTARDQLEQTERQVVRSTNTAFRDIMAAISEVRALEQAVESGKTALEATRAAYEAGTRTSVDLLNSISDLYQRQQQYAKARYDYVISLIALKQATGILTYQDLALINSWLQE